MARRVQGGTEVAALLKALPDAFNAEMADALTRGGRALKAAMAARAPRRTGALAAGIDYKVYPKTLRMKVGLLGTKAGRSDLFYGRIQDLGRRAQVVWVRRLVKGGRAIWLSRPGARRTRKPDDLVIAYQMRVRNMPGKRFVTGRFPDLRERMQRELQGIFSRAVTRAGG